MLRFEHTAYLWLLLGLVPFTLLYAWFMLWRKKQLQAFGKNTLVARLTPELSKGRRTVKFILLSLAYVFLIVGFANPQIGTKQEKVKRQGIDVMIALDVSNSMLSEDVKPTRLARAKNFISHFIDELNNDRLGMVVFAGRAYLQMPLTVDYSAARMYLRTINTNLVPSQGTNIAEAIDMACGSFVEKETKHKALIIISDGEDNEGGTDDAIKRATDEGVRIFTLGVGTENGGPIPVGSDYKRDEQGNIVLSKMNEEMMRDLAGKGNGKHYRMGSGKDEIDAILKELGYMGTKEFEEYVFTDYDDQFQWFLAIALLLLVTEWWISERKMNFKS